MDVTIVDNHEFPFSGFVSSCYELVKNAPCKFYANSTIGLIHVKKEHGRLIINRRPCTLTQPEVKIIEQSDSIEKVSYNEFIYDLQEKQAIYDLEHKKPLIDFYSYPLMTEGITNALIETNKGELKKIYVSNGNATILYSIRASKEFPYIADKEYTKFGFVLFSRLLGPLYAIKEASFSSVYETEMENIEIPVKEKHQLLSIDAPDLSIDKVKDFLDELDDSLYYNVKDDAITLSKIVEDGIPVTEDYVDVEIDMKMDGINKVKINGGILYVDSTLDMETLVEMFGEGVKYLSEGEK